MYRWSERPKQTLVPLYSTVRDIEFSLYCRIDLLRFQSQPKVAGGGVLIGIIRKSSSRPQVYECYDTKCARLTFVKVSDMRRHYYDNHAAAKTTY
jgi:hypothetical protein